MLKEFQIGLNFFWKLFFIPNFSKDLENENPADHYRIDLCLEPI